MTHAGLATYSAVETLRDGVRIEIRALRPDDRASLAAALRRTSAESVFRRFFGAKRGFTEHEIAFFLNVDFVAHVALVAVVDENGQPAIVGGGRYIVTEPGKAEIAFVVIDQYQGQGIGSALLRHLITIARANGFEELIADILPDNQPMLKVFQRCGLSLRTTRAAGNVHLALRIL